jgi:hypothetical protein
VLGLWLSFGAFIAALLKIHSFLVTDLL